MMKFLFRLWRRRKTVPRSWKTVHVVCAEIAAARARILDLRIQATLFRKYHMEDEALVRDEQVRREISRLADLAARRRRTSA